MIALIAAWCLSVMLALVPNGRTETYPETAYQIARESVERPLFGERSEWQTAATFLAFGFTESRYNPDAMGDCKKGLPQTPETCQSFGLFQISKAHAPYRKLFSPRMAVYHARALLGASVHLCGQGEKAFAWYAAGGQGCNPKGIPASKRRFKVAEEIIRNHPLP